MRARIQKQSDVLAVVAILAAVVVVYSYFGAYLLQTQKSANAQGSHFVLR